MDFDVANGSNKRTEKGSTFVPAGNRPLVLRHKPSLMLLGHGDAVEQLRALAVLLRPMARVSSYLGTEDNIVPTAHVEHAISEFEMLFVGLSSLSCNAEHPAFQLERHAVRLACAALRPIPVGLVLGARQGLHSPLTHAYGNVVQMVISEQIDETGGLKDLFPQAVHLATPSLDAAVLANHLARLTRPSATM